MSGDAVASAPAMALFGVVHRAENTVTSAARSPSRELAVTGLATKLSVIEPGARVRPVTVMARRATGGGGVGGLAIGGVGVGGVGVGGVGVGGGAEWQPKHW